MTGNLVVDLSNVTIPAIQRRAIENLWQADETLAASVSQKEFENVKIKKATLEFSIFYRGISY